MFEDVLKDSWVYQEWVEKGREEGLEKGREEGLEKGRQAQREAIEEIVKLHFPALATLAAKQVSRMADLNALRVLLVSIASARDEEVARRLLMDAGNDS
ncbi:MAG TPA: hypothetical protein VKV19_03425 [Ktedonobacteraceae bacterium]|nr:hypothetical protein [Ktedonobacteraceae bacterium]